MPNLSRAHVLLVMILGFFGCPKAAEKPRNPEPPSETQPQTTKAPELEPQPALTADQVRTLVYENHRLLDAEAKRLFPGLGSKNVVGRCHDSDAIELAPKGEILPALEARVGGKALPCYIRYYFGCVVGDVVAAVASDAPFGPNLVPYRDSKVTVIEATPTRVVADVQELIADAESGGKPFLDNIGVNEDPFRTSRYVLERSDDGRWRITDRVPPEEDAWRCP